jgi:hypothetical protein
MSVLVRRPEKNVGVELIINYLINMGLYYF